MPLSRHSSLNELRGLVRLVKPRDIYSCVVEDSQNLTHLNLEACFGDLCDLSKCIYLKPIRTGPVIQADALNIAVFGGEPEYSVSSEDEDRSKFGTSGSTSNVPAENTLASTAMSHRSEIHCNDKDSCLRGLEQPERRGEDLLGAGGPIDEQLVRYYMDLVQRGERIILKSVETNNQWA